MKVSIRQGVFETNSSSVHSLTMADQSMMDKWKNGDVVWHYYPEGFVDANDEKVQHYLELLNITENSDDEEMVDAAQEDLEDNYDPYEYVTYEMFVKNEWCDEMYETYHETHTTDSGEVVHAFGYYGHD